MTALWDWLPVILSITGVIGVAGVIVLLGMWPVVSSFLIGTRTGRIISALGALALTLLWAFVAGTRKGKVSERAKQKAANYRTIQQKVKIDESVRKLSPSDRRKRLDRWVRK